MDSHEEVEYHTSTSTADAETSVTTSDPHRISALCKIETDKVSYSPVFLV